MKARFFALFLLTLLAACASDPDLPKGVNAKDAARINLQLGTDYARRNDFDMALEKLKRSIKQDSSVALAHSTIAYVYSAKGMDEMADEEYRKALSLDSSDGTLHNNFGVFLCAHGKTDEALRNFVQAAASRNYTTPEVAWTNAGVCARRKPDLDLAERHFREALQVNPKFPDALAQMASVAYEKKDYLRCRAFVQRYLATGQATPENLWIAALNERQLGDIDTARDYESRIKREFPESEQAANLNSNKQ